MENKSLLLKSTMFYGLQLGIFWVVKYLFFIWGISHSSLGVVYWILTSLTLVFAYVFTRVYKMLIGGRIGFFHAWQFGVLLYFFSSLIVSLAHYVFYRYLAPSDYIAQMVDAAVRLIKDLNPQAEEALDRLPVFTPIRLTLQEIFVNVFYGAILSVPVAALLCRKRIPGIIYRENQEQNKEPNQ
jgi:hypothetical protein